MAKKGALNSSQGRAFPCLVLVRSMIQPITTLVIASMIFEMTGKMTKNNPPQRNPKPKTSV